MNNQGKDPFKKNPAIVFRLSGNGLAYYTIPLPLGAFICCILLSLIYDFEASTATHCRVANYLPSISAAIGGFTPQRYIWRICIGLHAAPRFMLAFMHYNHYKSYSVTYKKSLYDICVVLLLTLHIAENACLVTLTYVSSSENYAIHENSFIGFMVFSELYMILTLIMFRWARHGYIWSHWDTMSYRYKLTCFLLNISSFGLAVYFFFRHNAYCETGMYTGFAAGEYLVVCTNIAFHTVSFMREFGDGELVMVVPHRKKSCRDSDEEEFESKPSTHRSPHNGHYEAHERHMAYVNPIFQA